MRAHWRRSIVSDTFPKSLLFVYPSSTFARQLVSAIGLKSDLMFWGGQTLGTGEIIDRFKVSGTNPSLNE